MSKNYDDYKPINPMPPRRRKNPMLSFVQYMIIILLVIALIVAGAYFMILHKDSDSGEKAPVDTGMQTDNIPPETLPPETTGGDSEPQTPAVDTEAYKTVAVSKDQMNKGSLILVNSEHKVVYPTADELVRLLQDNEIDGASFTLSAKTILVHKDIVEKTKEMMDGFAAQTGKKDIKVQTGYRDAQRQETVYNQTNDATKAGKAGESTHNTGLGLALVVPVDGGTKKLSDVDEYSWLQENCYKYGFVERYPADKFNITGLDYSASYYIRYVGIPHAEIMKNNGYCLEEYLEFLKNYKYGTQHYEFTAENGSSYEIYYVESADNGGVVNIPVPKEGEYKISGNNMGGFIVTVKK